MSSMSDIYKHDSYFRVKFYSELRKEIITVTVEASNMEEAKYAVKMYYRAKKIYSVEEV